MGCDVYANGDEIACKAGSGKVIASFPDVCLTPPTPPAGPIPVPYPDTSFSKDMQQGSKTVKIEGQEIMLKDQSFYKTSPLGDEAATNGQGAGVITHVITGKTYFVAWSMDVKFEGQNVDRHTDITTSNHASPMANASVPNLNAAKPFKGTKQPYQTCEDDELKYVNDEKDINKKKLDKKDDCSPSRSEKMRGRIPCSRIKERIKAQEELLAARQLEQSECFANGPDPNNQKSQDAYRTHNDQINETANGVRNSQAQANKNCAPGHPMANL